jgi:hypothetical protein
LRASANQQNQKGNSYSHVGSVIKRKVRS